MIKAVRRRERPRLDQARRERLAPGPVCHVLLKIDRAGGDDIGPVSPGDVHVSIIGIPEDVRVGVTESGSSGHHAHLLVGSFIPAGDHHLHGIFLSVSCEFDGHGLTCFRLGAQILQGKV